MFERFTESARGVVVDAQEQARTVGHSEIMAEHLLLAILADCDSIGARVLRDLGVEREVLVKEVAALGRADDEALRAIGVDLTAVRQQAEAAFGPGALDRPRPRPRRYGLLRRVAWVDGHLPFTDSAKRALEQSLRQALALKHNYIGADHILLGLLADDQDAASRTLLRVGVTPSVVRTWVREQMEPPA